MSFPQHSASLLTMLPLNVDRAREFLTVYFTGPDRAVVRTARQYVVRRSKVEGALRWLRAHNRAYADIVIDPELLAKLPEDAVPECLVENAVPDPDGLDLQERGPDQAAVQQEPEVSASAPATDGEASAPENDVPFRAAVIDVEGGDLDPVRLWNCALKASDRSQSQADVAASARAQQEHDRADRADSCAAEARAKVGDALAFARSLHQGWRGGRERGGELLAAHANRELQR